MEQQRLLQRENSRKAKDTWSQKLLKDALTAKLDLCQDEEEMESFLKEHCNLTGSDLALVLNHKMREKDLEKSKEWLFITINPDPAKVGCTLEDIKTAGALMLKTLKSVQLKDNAWCWAFDQRSSKPEPPRGLHIHMVLHRRRGDGSLVKPKDIRKCFWGKWEKVCGYEQHLKIKNINTAGDLQRMINYVHGIKKDEKMPVADRTIEWLTEMGCPLVFEQNIEENIPTENDPQGEGGKGEKMEL